MKGYRYLVTTWSDMGIFKARDPVWDYVKTAFGAISPCSYEEARLCNVAVYPIPLALQDQSSRDALFIEPPFR